MRPIKVYSHHAGYFMGVLVAIRVRHSSVTRPKLSILDRMGPQFGRGTTEEQLDLNVYTGNTLTQKFGTTPQNSEPSSCQHRYSGRAISQPILVGTDEVLGITTRERHTVEFRNSFSSLLPYTLWTNRLLLGGFWEAHTVSNRATLPGYHGTHLTQSLGPPDNA
jgi:hypothetical protein